MAIPVAVSPSTKTPGLALSIDLTAGAASPSSGAKKALLVAVKSTSGTITEDTELIESVAGEEAAGTYLGVGTPGHVAAKRLFEQHGLAQVDIVAPAAPAGTKASQTVTFANSPTNDMVLDFWMAGRKISMTWAAGESATEGGDTFEAAINGLFGEGVATASNSSGVVTIEFRIPGLIGNDCTLRESHATDATGTITLGGANLAGGTLEPDYTNIISLIEGKEYDLYLPCISNAEAQVADASSNIGKLKTALEQRVSGFNAKLQQFTFGATDALSSIKTGTGTMNYERAQCVFCLEGESLPCEFAGAEVGARLRAEEIDPAVNRIETEYVATLYGCASPATDYPTAIEVEDALNTGITIVTYNASGELRPSRPITTYHKDANGAPDFRCYDVSQPTSCDAVAKDLRVNLPREFKGAKLSRNIEPGEDEPPRGVIQERDVEAFVDSRIKFWIDQGVVRGDKYAEAVENGTFVVQVDDSDEAQCDILLPLSIFPPLAKFSLVVQHRQT